MSENDNEAFEIAARHLQEDSTCFLRSSTEECRDYSREIDTSLTVICLSSAVKRKGTCLAVMTRKDTLQVHLCRCKHRGT